MGIFENKYDVVIIGASLSGLSCALELTETGKKILILERGERPGGVATSYVRNHQEFEVALHEMMSIGSPEHPYKVRRFLEKYGVYLDWKPIPELFHLVVKEDDIDITLHAGKKADGTFIASDEIEAYCPGSKEGVDKFFKLCADVYSIVDMGEKAGPRESLSAILGQSVALLKTADYSAQDVIDKLIDDPKVKKILSGYWVYLGAPMNQIPFVIYAAAVADYFTYGAYQLDNTSSEMSLKMAEAAQKRGVQIEYGQEVDKVYIHSGIVQGVHIKNGPSILTDYLASGVYPNTLYSKMIEPKEEVPERMRKIVNAQKLSLSCVSMSLLLDLPPEQLNIKDYVTFLGTGTFDSKRYFEESKKFNGLNYFMAVCFNKVNPNVCKQGQTVLNVTLLPTTDGYLNIKPDKYSEAKRILGRNILETMSGYYGVNLRDHVLEVEVQTPITVAHFSNTYRGGIYGFQHSLQDSVIVRQINAEKEMMIHGLVQIGAAGLSGDGMSPMFATGKMAANAIKKWMEGNNHAA